MVLTITILVSLLAIVFYAIVMSEGTFKLSQLGSIASEEAISEETPKAVLAEQLRLGNMIVKFTNCLSQKIWCETGLANHYAGTISEFFGNSSNSGGFNLKQVEARFLFKSTMFLIRAYIIYGEFHVILISYRRVSWISMVKWQWSRGLRQALVGN